MNQKRSSDDNAANQSGDQPDPVSNDYAKTAKLPAVKPNEPDSTVTIKVAPDQRLFTNDDARQATAPLRHPALHVRPSHNVGDQDAYRTPTQLRRTAHFNEVPPPPAPTATLKQPKPDKPDKPTPATAHTAVNNHAPTERQLRPPTDTNAPTEKQLHPPAYPGQPSPEGVGMDTVCIDDSSNTAVMEANCKTLVETGWRCPECKAPNRHRGAGKNPQVRCYSCGYDSVLTAKLVAPLEPESDAAKNAQSLNLVQGRTFLGKYMLDRFLGRGGMGEVWLGRHPNLDIPVAIKIMSTDLMARNPSYLERFLSEARTAAQMNHSNVVRIYDADHHDGMYFIVLEYMDGGDVMQWARKSGGKLKPRDAINVVIAVAEALEEAARFNIIHRDIKPENIMLTRDGGIKLADLGIAKRIAGAEEAEHFTFTAMILGTPAYISPEQALNASEVDMRADIYSLGATFYHLVTGSIPFPAKSPFQMMYKHVKEPLVNPRERNPDLAENITAVICKMMEKDPLDRYPDTEALLVDLYRIRDRDASVMQLQASQLPDSRSGGVNLSETHGALSAILAESANKTNSESPPVWRLAPVQLAIGAAIASLAVILGIQMVQPPPPAPEDGLTAQVRNAVLQIRRQQREAASQRELQQQTPPVTAITTPGPATTGGDAPPTVTPPPDSQPPQPVAEPPTPPTTVAQNPAVTELERQQELLALQRNRHEDRLREAQATWQRIRDADLDPSHGVERALLQAEQQLADARVAAAARQWDAADTHLASVVSLSLKAETIAKDRARTAKLVGSLRDARRDAIAAGAGELSPLQDQWQKLESEFATMEAAMTEAKFREVMVQAPELSRRYQRLASQSPAIQTREKAVSAFTEAYAAADRKLLEAWAADELAAVERARRLAAAETTRHAEAAAGFQKATALLTAAITTATNRRETAQQQRAEAAAKAAAAAREKRWQAERTDLDKLRQRAAAAAAVPRTEALAILEAMSLQSRVKEARELALTPEQTAYLDELHAEAVAIITRFSGAPRANHAWLVPELEMEMLPLARGSYRRGSAVGAEDERPEHLVNLTHDFWMGKYEVTQRQFRALMGNNPSALTGSSALPVESITWEQAMSFCRVINEREGKAGRLPTGYEYRLPTEAEWEYACRAGTTARYSFGDDPAQLAAHGNYCDRSFSGNSTWQDKDNDDRYPRTAPVGRYQPNAWGFHDMHGNVAEWCLDRYAKYPDRPATDPIGSGNRDERVFRGGNWKGAASLCRSAQRTAASTTYAVNSLGFRIVLGPAVILSEGGGISRLLAP